MQTQPLEKILIDSLTTLNDGIAVFDAEDRVIFCNEAFSALFSATPSQIEGLTFHDVMCHAQAQNAGFNVVNLDLETFIRQTQIKRKQFIRRAFEAENKNGRWYLISQHPTKDGYYFAYTSDITSQKKTEQALRLALKEVQRLAVIDDLTGVNNRRHFLGQAERYFNLCKKNNNSLIAVVFAVNNFRKINAEFGHKMADEILIAIAKKCQQILPNDTVFGRLGADEFAILMPFISETSALTLCQYLTAQLKKIIYPDVLSKHEINVSIGIAHLTANMERFDQVIVNADKAMQQAMTTNGHMITVFKEKH